MLHPSVISFKSAVSFSYFCVNIIEARDSKSGVPCYQSVLTDPRKIMPPAP